MALQGHLKVQTEALVQQAGTVRQQLIQMEKQFNELKRLINGTANFWIGEAGDHHRNIYQGNLGRIEEIIYRYQEHIIDLEQMAGVYDEAERMSEQIGDELPTSEL